MRVIHSPAESGQVPKLDPRLRPRPISVIITGRVVHDKPASPGGVRVHYVEAGQGSPVVLLHGLGASVAAWRENIGPLAERHRVYAVDLPGHGDSEKPDELSYSLPSMTNFTKSLVEALGHKQAAFAGSSIGGGLALMTALHHPDSRLEADTVIQRRAGPRGRPILAPRFPALRG